MLKNLSLTLKLSLLPAVALLGLLLFVIYTSVQLAANDARLDTLENNSFPTLEKADAVNFQFSRLPGMLNSAVAEHLRNHRLLFRDTPNITFGSNNSTRIRPVVDTQAHSLLQRLYLLIV